MKYTLDSAAVIDHIIKNNLDEIDRLNDEIHSLRETKRMILINGLNQKIGDEVQ